MSVRRPVSRYEYPLVKIDFLRELIERDVGRSPLDIVAQNIRDKVVITFDEELTVDQKSALDSLIERLRASPPAYYQYSQQASIEDVKAGVESAVGVRPISVGLDEQGRLASAVLERELTSTEEGALKLLLGKDYRKLVRRKL